MILLLSADRQYIENSEAGFNEIPDSDQRHGNVFWFPLTRPASLPVIQIK